VAAKGTAVETYEHLVRDLIAPRLRTKGFRRRGSRCFIREVLKNWQVVYFIAWWEPSPPKIVNFTVDLSIVSGQVYYFETGRVGLQRVPALNDMQWQDRLGSFLPDRADRGAKDLWWSLDEQIEGTETTEEPLRTVRGFPVNRVRDLAQEILGGLEQYAFPIMDRYTPDEALRDLWLAGKCRGISDLQRLEYLAILLVAIGPAQEIDRVLGELREKHREGREPIIDRFIERIESLRNWKR